MVGYLYYLNMKEIKNNENLVRSLYFVTVKYVMLLLCNCRYLGYRGHLGYRDPL